MKKNLECGFENAIELEEGRSPTSERTAVALSSPGPLTSPTSTLPVEAPAKLPSAKERNPLAAILSHNSKPKATCHVSKLEDHPLGYPRVARLLTSDIAFSMFRRFDTLHARLLLHKQDKIRELEEELSFRDQADDQNKETQKYLKCREDADDQDAPKSGRSRADIMKDIEKVLLEYGTLLDQAYKFEAMERPTDRDHASLTYFFDNEAPVCESDRDFLLHKEDLITIRAGRDHAWLDAAVESVLRLYPCAPTKYLFCDKETRAKSDNPKIHYFTRSRINFFVTMIITFLILVLLVVPIGVLYYLSVYKAGGAGDFLVIGVLLICTLVFSCALSLFTKAKRHELLAASAGYCAVLVVFVANVGTVGNNLSKGG